MAERIEMLLTELQEAHAKLEELNQRLSMKGDYGLGVGDPRIYEWEMTLARREKVENRIRTIEEALERANSGTYGVCDQCGRRIQVERLAALPFTNSCIGCARERG
jgi:RNA polymerase-binding transcription factor DksA